MDTMALLTRASRQTLGRLRRIFDRHGPLFQVGGLRFTSISDMLRSYGFQSRIRITPSADGDGSASRVASKSTRK